MLPHILEEKSQNTDADELVIVFWTRGSRSVSLSSLFCLEDPRPDALALVVEPDFVRRREVGHERRSGVQTLTNHWATRTKLAYLYLAHPRPRLTRRPAQPARLTLSTWKTWLM